MMHGKKGLATPLIHEVGISLCPQNATVLSVNVIEHLGVVGTQRARLR